LLTASHDVVVSECPGDTGKSCSGHGVCDDGVFGSGMCTCRTDFTGLACETCLTDHCVDGAMLYSLYLMNIIPSEFDRIFGIRKLECWDYCGEECLMTGLAILTLSTSMTNEQIDRMTYAKYTCREVMSITEILMT